VRTFLCQLQYGGVNETEFGNAASRDRQTDRMAERPCQRSGRRSNWADIHLEGTSYHVGFMVDRVGLG
jgi:hypothetical protein